MVSLNSVCPSVTKSNFPTGYEPPEWLTEKLDGGLETTQTFFIMLFTSLKFAHLDCCYSGRLTINERNQLVEGHSDQQGVLDIPQSDMTWAMLLGYGFMDDGFLLGWYKESRTWPSEYGKFSRNVWVKLHEGYDLYSAIFYAISQCNSTEVMNDFRIRGGGFLTNVRIE